MKYTANCMKSKIVVLLFLFVFYVTHYTFADNDQKIFSIDFDDLYTALESVCLESGLSLPSTSRPYTRSEFKLYLNRVSRYTLSTAGKHSYDYLIDQLNGNSLYKEQNGNLDINIKVKTNIEGYFHSKADYLDWEYTYQDRKPVIDIPFEIWIMNGFYAIMNPVLKKDPYTVGVSETKTNVITSFSDVDGHFPFKSFFTVGGDHWNVMMGRETLSWGNGTTGNLMLSDNADYHDFVRFTTFWKAFKFTTTYIGFDNWKVGDVSTAKEAAKLFLGHRIEIRFFDRIGIALSESMMLESNSFEPRYLNPFMVYHNWFLNDKYANVNLGLELEFNPYRWLSLYGQLCADQIQSAYEKKEYASADAMPNAYGYILGVKGSYPLWKGYLNAFFEWVKTDPWMYLMEGQPDYIVHRRVISNYLGDKKIRKQSLGYWLGPDSVVFAMGVGYKVFNMFDIEIELDLRQKGEISIDTPFESGPEAVMLNSPTGDYPEKKSVLSISGSYTPFDFITIGSELYWVHVLNSQNKPGEKKDDVQWVPYISFELSR